MSNSFNNSDYIQAKQAFAKWQSSSAEEIDDFILRQRKRELNELVKTVIENELSKEEKVLVELRWYENKTPSEIAEIIGVNRSTVSRRLQKINDLIYERLKYAMEYRFGKSFSSKAEMIIKSGQAYSSKIDSSKISGRLKKLRTEQCFTKKDLSDETGISEERLKELENNGIKMTVSELKKFTCLYGCSSDYIIFGH